MIEAERQTFRERIKRLQDPVLVSHYRIAIPSAADDYHAEILSRMPWKETRFNRPVIGDRVIFVLKESPEEVEIGEFGNTYDDGDYFETKVNRYYWDKVSWWMLAKGPGR